MKLRNKKTGEIKAFDEVMREAYKWNNYNSLAELNSEWEDAPEEPKGYWYISAYGNLAKTDVMTDLHRGAEEIGNLFSTREEAEKAVERLRAWKRLKDKGFRFIEGWLDNNDDFIIKAKLGYVGLIDQPDVHLLFGGEE